MAAPVKAHPKTAAPPRTAAPPTVAPPKTTAAETALTSPAAAAVSFFSDDPINSAPIPDFKTPASALAPAAADNSFIVYLAAAGAALFFLLRKG